MDAVKSFNAEVHNTQDILIRDAQQIALTIRKSFLADLSSLYDVKPPISKAKMTALTRGAIKAIKFYKHVVQSVEKFILKCKPEYKVPGLYVIDSIVRQSRHQFGSDKDVFAPRFAKNMQNTFVNLFRCPPEDKSKVIRVLNLWQKNQVFAPEVIQPLFDLADPNHPIHREQAALASNGSPATVQKTPTKTGLKSGDGGLWQNTPQQQDAATNALAHLGVASLAANPNALLQLSGQSLDPTMLAQLQTLQRLLLRQTGDSSGTKQDGGQVHFDRKLLDFDYGSDEDEDHTNPSPKAQSGLESVGSLLSNPEVMRQLQNLQLQLSQQQQIEMEEKMRKLQEMKQQEEEFDKHLAQTVPNLPFAAECELKPVSHTNSPANLYKHEPAYILPTNFDLSQPPPGYKPVYDQQGGSQEETMDTEIEFVDHPDNGDVEVINLDHTDSRSQSPHDDRYSRRRRSRSRDRSRDRDRDRERRSRRSRSRSRSRRRRSRSRDRERDREKEKEKEKEREKDRERRKRGLPPIKKDNLSVCSTTLWVGHLSKLVHQEDLSDTFGEFGDIVSIDLIPPRGCAFIVMNRRQDAARCLSKLKNHKMQGKAITLAWAPGKGVKGKDYKDYWEVELGVSYIPWTKLKPDLDLELLEEGGMVDEDTMPEWLKAKQAETAPKPVKAPAAQPDPAVPEKSGFIPLPDGTPVQATGTPTTSVDTSQPPPLHTGGLLPPPHMAMPIVSPFSLNTRLLGPMGHMSLPPGLMPSVPIGVPPPNIPGAALMSNQLLGLGSPFGQGLPGMPPQPMSQIPLPGASNQDNNKTLPNPGPPGSGDMPNLPEAMLSMGPHGFSMMSMTSNDDNMDIEMEDAEKSDKPIPLSDQLLASIGGGSFNTSVSSGSNINMNVGRFGGGNIPPLIPPHADIDERQLGPNRDGRDSRPRERNDRDRERERDRSRRNSRERGRERDREVGGGRNDRRDRNRWSDRDRRDRDRVDRDLNDKKPEQVPARSEKSLADRLREMAHEGVVPNRDRPRERTDDKPPSLFEAQPPVDMPGFPPFPNGDPHLDILEQERLERERIERERLEHERLEHERLEHERLEHERMERERLEQERMEMAWRDRMEPDMYRRGHPDDYPIDDYDPRMRRHPDDYPDDPRLAHADHDPRMAHPDYDPRMAHPDYDPRRPIMHPDDIPRMDHDRYDYGMRGRDSYDRRENFARPDDMRMMDDYEHRMRGPDFYAREGFGPPRPLLRGPGPDGFPPPRPLLGRPPGPHMFHPRGPMGIRGPRPGPWMDNIRPNFPPRFEGPEYFNRMPFDDPHHPRHRRHEDRRRLRSEESNQSGEREHEKPDRKSRWGNSSPTKADEVKEDGDGSENQQELTVPGEQIVEIRESNAELVAEKSHEDDQSESKPRGGTTPLRDEPEDLQQAGAGEVKQDSVVTQDAESDTVQEETA